MINIVNLTKTYGNIKALDSLNLSIEKGSVFGYVGHNGAGKSTTFSILATLLAPTSGTATINGYDVTKQPHEVRRHIGYMPDFFGVYDQLRADEYLDFYGASYGIPSSERDKLIPELLELVHLSNKKDSYVDLLSRGMKQRLCLARALIHNPEVLILDEPASGLDPRARIEMRGIMKNLKEMGKTIMISSHILPELAEMCDTIGVINGGKLVATGRVEEVHKRLQANKIFHVTVLNDIDGALKFFAGQSTISNVEEKEKNTIIFSFTGSEEEQVDMLHAALQHGLKILNFSQEATDLEDIFMEITKGVEE
ncbi:MULTISPECIES: ABC transporter ATP-binding protein [Bacillus]|uniref:ABC transporter ATP-binding protein n=1 Tax=Bacillus TaxID=1386 RepID=UPI000BB8B56F|nr:MULTISPECIES: ABC transporter ATP-binding protein [Bacillus]